MKKIDFVLSREEYDGWAEKPYPAIKNIPQWYKEKELFHSNPISMMEKSRNMTIKGCVPFRDMMGAGYFIPLSHDVEVIFNPETGGYEFSWLVETKSIEPHDLGQVAGMDIPDGFDGKSPMKWTNPWTIKTPKGYSCIFISPQLRDLPFHSLPAIVDTDKFNLPINFPFFIKKGFSGVIEKGAPIIQVIPFKRDDWKSSTDNKEFNIYKNSSFLYSKFLRVYRNNFWSRKSFT